MRKFNTVDEWLDWQQTVHPLNIDFKLERILSVYKKLNISKIANKIITVAGTNGKGSTVSFLESVLNEKKYRVGTFTSPHILRYNERIKINGIEIDDESLLETFEMIDEVRGDTTLTYFEFATLSAFYLFSKSNLDVAVLEVGLGGRLDATNIVDSDISIITSIPELLISTVGIDSFLCINFDTFNNLAPILPPGCKILKSSTANNNTC